MALDWQTVHVPLAAGLNTKDEPRALEPPALEICRDAEFDELGGIQTRRPYQVLGALPGNAEGRRLAVYRDELVCFSKDKLYSWSATEGAWQERATYLAPKVTEKSVFTRTSAQTLCSRAELNGVVMYAWQDATASEVSYLAAVDAETGAILYPATSLGSGTAIPRLLVLDTRIVIIAKTASTTLSVKEIDPLDIATGVAASWTDFANFNTLGYYDAEQYSGDTYVIAYTRSTTTSYSLVSKAVGAAATNTVSAYDSVGPIAVTVAAGALASDKLFVVRDDNSGNIVAEVYDSLTSVASDNIGLGAKASSVVAQITAKGIWTGGATAASNRCVVWIATGQSAAASNGYECQVNWLDGAAVVGTIATFRYRLTPAAKPFVHDGRVYIWLVFGQTSTQDVVLLQNTYFLYRADEDPDPAELTTGESITGRLIAKAAGGVAGGFPTPGQLSSVQSLGGNRYAWCGVERRVIPTDGGPGYSAQSPRDIIVELDSDEARRAVRLGNTLYIAGGQVVQYDGEEVAEVGFHLYPHYLAVTDDAAGSLAVGTYAWKATVRWENAAGELERSTTANIDDQAIAASRQAGVAGAAPHVTLKRGRSLPALEIWRTAVNPVDSSPYFLATGKDPATTTGDNPYIVGDPDAANFTSIIDDMVDATLTTKETDPETGGVLESLAPPAASIIATDNERIFLAGIANDPHAVWYSKLRGEGEIAAFHDALKVQLPSTGGDITALAFLNETLVVLKEHAIYALPGQGFDNLGSGQNYGPARVIALDVGAQSAEVVATIPQGLIFHSSKGWFLLNRGWSVEYIGAAVDAFDDDTFVSIDVIEDQHQIRCLSTSRMLVFDYVAQQWSEWTIGDAVHSLTWKGVHTILEATGTTRTQRSDHVGLTYGLDVQTAWIKLTGLQGYQSVRRLQVLGEYRSAHDLRIRVARDYRTDYTDDKSWTATPTEVGGPEQVRHGPSFRKCQAIKVRITATAVGSDSPPTGEAVKLTGLGLEVGARKGLRRLPAAQSQ